MSSNLAPADTAGSAVAPRPKTVDYALYAMVARCVFALGAAISLFGARSELRRDDLKLHPDWSAAKLDSTVSSFLKSNLIANVGFVVVVLVLAKLVRDGRNWSRWVFALVSFVLTGDVVRVTAFFNGENIPFKVLSGMTGVSAIVAILLLFLRSSSQHFQPEGKVSASPLRLLFGGGRQAAIDAAAANSTTETVPADKSMVNLTKKSGPARRPNGSPRPNPGPRSPRAKSRRPAE